MNATPKFPCTCGAALDWKDGGRYWRADCAPCNLQFTILKKHEALLCFVPNCADPECRREHVELV